MSRTRRLLSGATPNGQLRWILAIGYALAGYTMSAVYLLRCLSAGEWFDWFPPYTIEALAVGPGLCVSAVGLATPLEPRSSWSRVRLVPLMLGAALVTPLAAYASYGLYQASIGAPAPSAGAWFGDALHVWETWTPRALIASGLFTLVFSVPAEVLRELAAERAFATTSFAWRNVGLWWCSIGIFCGVATGEHRSAGVAAHAGWILAILGMVTAIVARLSERGWRRLLARAARGREQGFTVERSFRGVDPSALPMLLPFTDPRAILVYRAPSAEGPFRAHEQAVAVAAVPDVLAPGRE